MTVGARWPGFRSGAGKNDRAIFVPSNDVIVSSRAAAAAGNASTRSARRTAALRPIARNVPVDSPRETGRLSAGERLPVQFADVRIHLEVRTAEVIPEMLEAAKQFLKRVERTG